MNTKSNPRCSIQVMCNKDLGSWDPAEGAYHTFKHDGWCGQAERSRPKNHTSILGFGILGLATDP